MAAIVPQMSSGYSREGSTLQHREYFDRSMETGAGGIFTPGGSTPLEQGARFTGVIEYTGARIHVHRAPAGQLWRWLAY